MSDDWKGLYPSESLPECATTLVDRLDTDRALAYAVVGFTAEGRGGAALGAPGSGETEAMAELQLLGLLLRAIAEDHGKTPAEAAQAAVAIVTAEEALQGATSLANLVDAAADWTDVDVEGVREGGDE